MFRKLAGMGDRSGTARATAFRVALLGLLLMLAGTVIPAATALPSRHDRGAPKESGLHGIRNSPPFHARGVGDRSSPDVAAAAAVSPSKADEDDDGPTDEDDDGPSDEDDDGPSDGPDDGTTDGLDQLANQLDDDPRRIYNWVRANVTFEPGWGSVLGAEGCRQTLTCDAHDTASLLLALLEAAGFDARYVTGVVDVDANLFKSVVGDMDTLAAASKAADNTGWPHEILADGSRVRLAHVWVEARLGHKRYTALDASLKPHRFTEPDPLGVNPESLRQDLATTLTHDPQAATVSGFDGAAFDAKIDAAVEATFARFAGLRPGRAAWTKKLRGLFGTLAPDVQSLSVRKAAPPGQVVEISGRDEALPDAIRHRVRVRFPSAGGLPATDLYLDELAGVRLTVDFGAADQAAVDAVAAAGGPWAVAPRSILLRPVLIADGEPVLTGDPIAFTDFQAIETRVIRPDGVVSSGATNFVRSGSVAAIILDPVRVGSGTLEVVRDRIGALAKRLRANPPTMSFDELHGEVLLAHGLAYFSLVDIATELAAHRIDVREIAAVPGIAIVSWQPVPGSGGTVTAGSMQIDAQQIGTAGGVARDGDPADAAAHRQSAGAFSSGMEGGVFDTLLDLNATSSVDILRRTLDAGRPIGAIVDASSLATVFGQLAAPANVRDFIANSFANGFDSFVPLSPTTIGDWTGTGWAQLRDDGAFGFLLAGAISGGAVTDNTGAATQAAYDSSVSGGLTAAGQSTKFVVRTGANVASTVLGPIGAGIETYTTIKEIKEAGGDIGQQVGTGVMTGLTRGAIGIVTDVAATAVLPAGPEASVVVILAGSEIADKATTAIKNATLENIP